MDVSRSRRKTPIIGFAGDTDKPFKVQEHQKQRSKVKVLLKSDPEADLPDEKEFGDPWDSMKDGKQWLREEIRDKYMRK